MSVRILDLDGSVAAQGALVARQRASVLPLAEWGPRLRLACGWRAFRAFEGALATVTSPAPGQSPHLTFCGSGDFHHASLALLRHGVGPCNLLVIDKHPDWVRGVPFLHCGTWLWHAARLPNVGRIFHVGGALDFDNGYRWLAPWRLLRSGKIVVWPAIRRFRGRRWSAMAHQPLRSQPEEPAGRWRVNALLAPYREVLASAPLYISLDKDVLSADEAIVNWDSGHLTTPEVLAVIHACCEAARGVLAGIDIVGDWSEVRVCGPLRRALHWVEHPSLQVESMAATRHNERHNLALAEELVPLLSQRYRQNARAA